MLPNSTPEPNRRLSIVTLYVTERCNSRCVTCDYWRNGRAEVSLDAVRALLPDLERLRTRIVVLSGGEPLIHPEWEPLAEVLKRPGREVWLLTSGLSLAKHARRAARIFDSVTVSLDGTERASYAAIRGLDAFEKVCEGVRALAVEGAPPGIRVTLQGGNYRELVRFVDLAKQLGARRISFLAVDVANADAFGRTDHVGAAMGLTPAQIIDFGRQIEILVRERAADFDSGFIAESPAKLARILQYFAALRGQVEFPPVRCNAPEFSAVIDAAGRVRPCFFIGGPPDARIFAGAAQAQTGFADTWQGEEMSALRAAIGTGARPECMTCVCSMWRDPAAFA